MQRSHFNGPRQPDDDGSGQHDRCGCKTWRIAAIYRAHASETRTSGFGKGGTPIRKAGTSPHGHPFARGLVSVSLSASFDACHAAQKANLASVVPKHRSPCGRRAGKRGLPRACHDRPDRKNRQRLPFDGRRCRTNLNRRPRPTARRSTERLAFRRRPAAVISISLAEARASPTFENLEHNGLYYSAFPRRRQASP